MKIKIAFVDFWPGFIPENSYFFDLLGGTNKVELSESPEIIFFSNFGSEAKVKEAGKLRVEGKEYIVKDGDVMHFRFNV